MIPPPRRLGRARWALVVFVVVSLIGAAALVAAGARDHRRTAFSLDVETGAVSLELKPGQRACQGPINALTPFSGVELWVGDVPAPGTTLRVSATGAGMASASTGSLPLAPSPFSIPSVRLSRVIRGGPGATICIHDVGRRPVALLGGEASSSSGALRSGGHSRSLVLAMVMLRQPAPSLLAMLPTVFSRASLFRPTIIGPWTYWLLLAGVVAAFVLCGVGLAKAQQDDEAEPPS